MRVFLLIVLSVCSLIVGPSGTKAQTERHVSKVYWKMSLDAVMAHRCAVYGDLISKNTAECVLLIRRMSTILDFDVARFNGPADMGGLAAFSEELVSLLKRPEPMAYLAALYAELQSGNATRMGDLYSWTLNFSGNRQEVALQWIAVFFQDSVFGEHVDYLKELHGNTLPLQIKLLESVNLLIHQSKTLKLYPPGLGDATKAQYHFYVPAYLAFRIQKSLGTPKQIASFVPFLFNLTYEFVLESCMKGDSVGSPNKRFLGFLARVGARPEPEAMPDFKCMNPPEWKREGSLVDIYLGLSAGLWGGGFLKPGKFPEYPHFRDQFSTGPKNFIIKEMKQKFN